jgi:hypothetical protein
MSGETKLIIAMSVVGIVFVLALVGLAVVVLATQPVLFGAPNPGPTSTSLPSLTSVASPTFYILNTMPPTPTTTNTPLPTDTPPPTDTPAPTDTPPPTATNPPAPVYNPPAPTEPPPPPASLKGLTGAFSTEGGRTQFAVGERIWFNLTVTNPTGGPVSYGRLGVAVEENGQNLSDLFHTSYSETTLHPGEVFNHRDWLALPRPGNFVLRLSICYPDMATCQGGGQWEYLSAGVAVTVS